jgi:hypothetical protein
MLPEIYINKVLFEQGQLRRKTFVVILPRQQPIWQVHPTNPNSSRETKSTSKNCIGAVRLQMGSCLFQRTRAAAMQQRPRTSPDKMKTVFILKSFRGLVQATDDEN